MLWVRGIVLGQVVNVRRGLPLHMHRLRIGIIELDYFLELLDVRQAVRFAVLYLQEADGSEAGHDLDSLFLGFIRRVAQLVVGPGDRPVGVERALISLLG